MGQSSSKNKASWELSRRCPLSAPLGWVTREASGGGGRERGHSGPRHGKGNGLEAGSWGLKGVAAGVSPGGAGTISPVLKPPKQQRMAAGVEGLAEHCPCSHNRREKVFQSA